MLKQSQKQAKVKPSKMPETRINKRKTRIFAGFSVAEMEVFEPYKNGLNKRNNRITVHFLWR